MTAVTDFFALVAVSSSTFTGGGNPDAAILLSLPMGGLMLYNKHASAIVEYSFDGSTLHGELDPADGTRGKAFDWRQVNKIWFRIKSGSTGPANVSIEAWAVGR